MIDLRQGDCMIHMKSLGDKSIDMICTDIPYDGVNKNSHGLRVIDKGKADAITFDLNTFLKECIRVCRGVVCIFCGHGQFSQIFTFFDRLGGGCTRPIVWEKTNPSPMNGEYVYLSGAELCVWYKPRGWNAFSAFCKSNVFEYPCGTSKLHPTEKNYKLIEELILDNTNEGDTVLDMCMGSGTTGEACAYNNRNFIGFELDKEYFHIAEKRIRQVELNYQPSLF